MGRGIMGKDYEGSPLVNSLMGDLLNTTVAAISIIGNDLHQVIVISFVCIGKSHTRK